MLLTKERISTIQDNIRSQCAFLNGGGFADVYESKNRARVIKVSTWDNNYLAFLDLVNDYGPTPHLPKIYVEHRSNDGALVVVMERLEPLPVWLSCKWSCYWLESQDEYEDALDAVLDSMENDQHAQWATNLFTPDFYDVAMNVLDYGEARDRYFDMHIHNIMIRRKAGKRNCLVITDPFC